MVFKFFDMKMLFILLISIFSFSFCPSPETNNKQYNAGFYIFVENLKDRSYNKFIVETKDSALTIFKSYFKTELELGEVQNPISIFNGDLNFYIARVNVFISPDGKKNFTHLNYPGIGKKNLKLKKRLRLKPVTL